MDDYQGKTHRCFVCTERLQRTAFDERTASLIKECYPDIKGISAGQKTSRAVKKICTLIGITSNTYSDFEKRYAKYSDAINPLDVVRHTILSVNPVDYLLSSNGNSWSSCHTLDKNNPNGFSGCHCSGTMSYLLDGTTMVYYQVDKEYDGNDLEFEPKIIRQLFHYKDGILVQEDSTLNVTMAKTHCILQLEHSFRKSSLIVWWLLTFGERKAAPLLVAQLLILKVPTTEIMSARVSAQ